MIVFHPFNWKDCILTRYSRVLGISKIDFTPQDITATSDFPSSVKSADTSKVYSACRWTPPIPENKKRNGSTRKPNV